MVDPKLQVEVGTILLDRRGRKWRKVHRLSEEDYRRILSDLHGKMRAGIPITEDDLYSLGFSEVVRAITQRKVAGGRALLGKKRRKPCEPDTGDE